MLKSKWEKRDLAGLFLHSFDASFDRRQVLVVVALFQLKYSGSEIISTTTKL